MNTKQWLGRARHLDLVISNLMETRQSVFDSATRITQSYKGDGVQTTNNPHKFDSLAELESFIDEKIDEYVNITQEILKTIMMIPDERQRNVLLLYYTVKDSKTGKPLTWEQVAVQMNYSYKQTRRIHGKALAVVDRILEERGKDCGNMEKDI